MRAAGSFSAPGASGSASSSVRDLVVLWGFDIVLNAPEGLVRYRDAFPARSCFGSRCVTTKWHTLGSRKIYGTLYIPDAVRNMSGITFQATSKDPLGSSNKGEGWASRECESKGMMHLPFFIGSERGAGAQSSDPMCDEFGKCIILVIEIWGVKFRTRRSTISIIEL